MAENEHLNQQASDPGEGQPAGDAPAAAKDLLDLSADDLLGEGLDEAARASDDSAPGDDEPEDSDDGQAATAGTEPSEASRGGEGKPPKREFADWVELLAVDPKRETEVPQAIRERVKEQALRVRQSIGTQTAQQLLRQAQEVARQTAELHEQAATLQELWEAGDVEAFQEKAAENPQAHLAWLTLQKRDVEGKIPPDESKLNDLRAQARATVALLDDDPEGKERILANYRAGKYSTDEAGVEAMRKDVLAELRREAEAAPAPDLERRRAAAARRKALPKADVSPGTAVPVSKTTAKELLAKSDRELLAEGLEESAAARS